LRELSEAKGEWGEKDKGGHWLPREELAIFKFGKGN